MNKAIIKSIADRRPMSQNYREFETSWQIKDIRPPNIPAPKEEKTTLSAVAASRHTPAEPMATMLITVEADNLPLIQRAVASACGESARLLRTQAVPCSTQMRVWLILVRSAATTAMGAIMRTVSHGEIGPIGPET
jgi:hypothetical protein